MIYVLTIGVRFTSAVGLSVCPCLVDCLHFLYFCWGDIMHFLDCITACIGILEDGA